MEVDRRPFQSVNVGMANVETGRDRFVSDDIHRPPPHATWRCNLTALSQRYNLYFMASREGIAVFEPDFPFQKLQRTPKIYITPTLAEPMAEGYLDSHSYHPGRHPHDINHLIVGDLGSEEILLASTDSGNVSAYHTKAIYDAIQGDPYRFSPDARAEFVGLRSFFSQWVHESAWGLAIHKEGRMIAVSANVATLVGDDDPGAKITVFAFALSSPTDRREDDGEKDLILAESPHTEWHSWDPSTMSQAVPKRDRSFKIILGGEEGHSTNIPSISFVNTREDPDGSWLLSCDIHGDTKCWQIWRGVCFGTWDFAETSDALRRRRQRHSDGGWMVAALDVSSFRPTTVMETFCGHRKVPQYFGHFGSGDSYDITNAVRLKTPGRSQRHPAHDEESEEDENDAPEPEEVDAAWSEKDSDEASDVRTPSVPARTPLHSRLSERNPTSRFQRPQHHEMSMLMEDELVEGIDYHDEPMQPASPDAEVAFQFRQILQPVGAAFDALDGLNEPELAEVDSNSEADREGEEEELNSQVLSGSEEDFSTVSNPSSTPVSNQTQRTSVEVETSPPMFASSPELSSGDAHGSHRKSTPPTKRQRQAQTDLADLRPVRIPFIPTLHLSQSHLRLINLPRSRSPHLFCANILKQDLPEMFHHTHHYALQRLNMLHQIPELGIVIIASQLGRAAICSLTRYIPNDALGLRVDWILPTRRQEKAGMRPSGSELLGIAVAPIQGRQMRVSDPTEEREDEAWAKDRVIDGVDTTFDEKVVVLSGRCGPVGDFSSDEDALRWCGKRRSPKRTRHSFSSSKSSSSSVTSTEQRPWPSKPKQGQDWEVVEGTRRYRLMMTYSDMTVLTYEIGRGVERDETAISVDALNVLAFWAPSYFRQGFSEFQIVVASKGRKIVKHEASDQTSHAPAVCVIFLRSRAAAVVKEVFLPFLTATVAQLPDQHDGDAEWSPRTLGPDTWLSRPCRHLSFRAMEAKAPREGPPYCPACLTCQGGAVVSVIAGDAQLVQAVVIYLLHKLQGTELQAFSRDYWKGSPFDQ